MSKENYKIEKVDDLLVFHDGEKYILLDTGYIHNRFGKNSESVNGRIGPFKVGTRDRSFFDGVINISLNDGEKVSGIFNPMDGYNCLLEGDTLTIFDEEIDHGSDGIFFPFAEVGSDSILSILGECKFPFIEGSLNGTRMRFFFDTGARMTMFGEESLVSQPPIRTNHEWLAMLQVHEDLPVYNISLEFPNGFKYNGEGSLVKNPLYQLLAKTAGFRAILGIDILKCYDLLMTFNGERRGIELFEKK